METFTGPTDLKSDNRMETEKVVFGVLDRYVIGSCKIIGLLVKNVNCTFSNSYENSFLKQSLGGFFLCILKTIMLVLKH